MDLETIAEEKKVSADSKEFPAPEILKVVDIAEYKEKVIGNTVYGCGGYCYPGYDCPHSGD